MRDKVEMFITNSPSLSMCADLCNGIKHLSIDPLRSRSEKDPQFSGRTQRVFLDTQPILVCQGFAVKTGSGTRDAFDLAWGCMMDWFRFITLKGEGV